MKRIILISIAIFLSVYYNGKSDKLYTWGSNYFGELGDGTKSNHDKPERIGNLVSWAHVVCGGHFMIALKYDGSIWSWGTNEVGQCGDGTTIERLNPVAVGIGSVWSQVACGGNHSLALKPDGSLWVWGSNNLGQLGDGTTLEEHSPTRIGSENNWLQVSAGWAHSLAIKKNGTLWAWGYNFHGQLGDGTTTDRHSPVQIGSATDWKSVACANGFTVALKQNGTLWIWGDNTGGQLGDGTSTDRKSPVQIGTDTDCDKLPKLMGSSHAVIKTDGRLFDWSNNSFKPFSDLTSKWKVVALGGVYSMGIKQDGTLWSLDGNGISGHDKDSTGKIIDSLVQYGTDNNWTDVSVGFTAAAALNGSPCYDLTALPDSVYFPDRACRQDTTIMIVIGNSAAVPIQVTQTKLAEGSLTKLDLINGGQFTVPALDTVQLFLKIKPWATGKIKDTLIIMYPMGCDTVLRIPISGIRDTINFDLYPLDTLSMGLTCPDVPLDTFITIRNTSSKATKLSSNNLTQPFTITGSDVFTSIFALNESKKQYIRFQNSDTGTFYQDFTVTDSCGKMKKIVLKAVVHYFTVDAGEDLTLCARDTVLIGKLAESGSPPFVYHWLPAKGLSDVGSAITKASPFETTVYYLTVTDRIGCIATDSITINVNHLPKPVITGFNVACEGSTCFYYGGTPDSCDNRWAVSGAQSYYLKGSDTLVVTWGKPGSGKIILMETVKSTECKDSTDFEIKIVAGPKPEFTGDSITCTNTAYQYISATKKLNNEWITIAGKIVGNSFGDTVNVIWSNESNARIKLVQTNSSGCSDSAEMAINVSPSPLVSLLKKITICQDSAYKFLPVLSPNDTGSLKFSWTPEKGLDNPHILNPVLSSLSPGEYRYVLTVTNARGCYGSDTSYVYINPLPEITLSKDLLDFGNLDPCKSSKTDSLTISNTGSQDMNVERCLSGSGFTVLSPVAPFKMKKGESKTVVISYSALKIGQVNGNVIFSGSPCNWGSTIKCSANKSELLFSTQVSNINFGKELICSLNPVDTSFFIINSSTEAITTHFENCSVGFPFSLISPKTSTVIAPNDSISVSVSYNPVSVGSFSNLMRVPFEGGSCSDTISLPMIASVYEPQIGINLKQITFPDISGCDNSADTTITIINEGTIDAQIAGIEPGSIFSTDGLNADIAPGDSAKIKIKFTPKNKGNYSGKLIIKFNPCDILDTIAITGTKDGVVFEVPDSVDFGEFIFCDDNLITKDLIFSVINRSSAGIDGEIKTLINIDAPFSTDMKSGDALPNGVTTNFEATATINSSMPDGEIKGTLSFIITPCDSTKIIKLRAKKSSVILASTNSISFGNMQPGTYKDDTVRVKNDGTAAVEIKSAGNITNPFRLIKSIPEIPSQLSPGKEMIIIIRYAPIIENIDSAILIINAEPCGLARKVMLSGSATDSNKYETILSPGNISAYADEIVNIPLLLSNLDKIKTAGITEVSADLSYNSTLLMPLDYSAQKLDETNSKISLNSLLIENMAVDTLVKVRFRVGLGNAGSCRLMLSNISSDAKKVEITSHSGTFNLLGICPEGGARLINPNESGGILSIQPNPATNTINIKFSSIEEGFTEIYIYNEIGDRVKTLFSLNITDFNTTTIKYNISDLSTGNYMIVFKSPTIMQNVQMVVVR